MALLFGRCLQVIARLCAAGITGTTVADASRVPVGWCRVIETHWNDTNLVGLDDSTTLYD